MCYHSVVFVIFVIRIFAIELLIYNENGNNHN